MRRGPASTALLFAFAALSSLCAAEAGAAGDPSRVGAYCPLPEPGQKPACLLPAEQKYADFFRAVERGEVDEAGASAVEADLDSRESAYLALSSVAYAYWQLAQRRASDPTVHPTVAVRLEHWNALLSSAYERSENDPPFRGAVRLAAEELEARVPSSGLLAAIEAVDAGLGVKGPLGLLLERVLAEPAP